MTEFTVSEVIDGEPLRLKKAGNEAKNFHLDRPTPLRILLAVATYLSPLCKIRSFLLLRKGSIFASAQSVAAWFVQKAISALRISLAEGGQIRDPSS